MRLSLQTDYALRTLMYLASASERATVEEIAQFYRISGDHVAKVVSQLVRLGLVRSRRGPGGGVELARDPASISVGEVIQAFEGPVHLLDCLGQEGVCVIESFCKLKSVLAKAERIQREYLAGVSLQDVLPTRAQIRNLSRPAKP
ncbi:MAG: Rrf2 family transcriptional regulator [Gemmatales bacterium]|nr:Rrf2 family transcriptional regulator [Gemmatales bacterium]MDW8386021.1 Rrf2 family transcriptional regulator [Gemmatales bacterium]